MHTFSLTHTFTVNKPTCDMCPFWFVDDYGDGMCRVTGTGEYDESDFNKYEMRLKDCPLTEVGSSEPKPCPFCGCPPKVSAYDYKMPSGKTYARQYLVECRNDGCPAQPTVDWHYFTEEEAIKAWNRRAK